MSENYINTHWRLKCKLFWTNYINSSIVRNKRIESLTIHFYSKISGSFQKCNGILGTSLFCVNLMDQDVIYENAKIAHYVLRGWRLNFWNNQLAQIPGCIGNPFCCCHSSCGKLSALCWAVIWFCGAMQIDL